MIKEYSINDEIVDIIEEQCTEIQASVLLSICDTTYKLIGSVFEDDIYVKLRDVKDKELDRDMVMLTIHATALQSLRAYGVILNPDITMLDLDNILKTMVAMTEVDLDTKNRILLYVQNENVDDIDIIPYVAEMLGYHIFMDNENIIQDLSSTMLDRLVVNGKVEEELDVEDDIPIIRLTILMYTIGGLKDTIGYKAVQTGTTFPRFIDAMRQLPVLDENSDLDSISKDIISLLLASDDSFSKIGSVYENIVCGTYISELELSVGEQIHKITSAYVDKILSSSEYLRMSNE